MRIVGGRWRGRPLSAPEGRGTRPTTDRVRESLASMVLSTFDLDLSDVSILDAFAGSGAVGLELLSRGARRCTFVERDARAAKVVRSNIASLGASPLEAQVQVGDVCGLARRAAITGGPFALVVLDPPYAMDAAQVAQLICDLRDTGSLADEAIVLYEHATNNPELDLADSELIKQKKRGTTTVSLLRLTA